MDLMEHAAAVWARKYLLLAVALTVAIGVYALRSTAPEQYEATTTLQIRLPDTQVGDPSSQADFYGETVVGLATSRLVVEQALAAVDRDDDPDDAADDITAAADGDSFLELGASGSTPEEAVDLTVALADVLIEQVAAEQAADFANQRAAVTQAVAQLGRDRRTALSDGTDPFERAALDREREALLGSLRTIAEKTPWRLEVVVPAVEPRSPSAPTPTRDALLALILVLILGAELIVARRAWRGSLSVRDPAKDAGDVAGVPALVVRPDQSAAALTPLLPAIGSARAVNVIQSGRVPQAHTVALLAELLAARGEDVLLIDAGKARPTVHAEYGLDVAPGLAELRRSGNLETRLKDLPGSRGVHVLPAGEVELSSKTRRLADVVKAAPQDRIALATSVSSVDGLLDVVADLDGPLVLDVDGDITRKQLRSQVETLRGLGLDLVAVTVSTGDRTSGRRAAARRTSSLAEA
ncbi:hypothetical protein [Nocardioides sp.]|uniref:hypothetical protein n=1 Tax=Nocardioides sp. TaxID=35761 RepID=UPI002B26C722|nr:hypothetical protein [Nocardioides sp.]